MRTTGYQGTTRGANLTQCAANYTRYLRRALPENPESYYKLELGAWILALSLRVDVAVVTSIRHVLFLPTFEVKVLVLGGSGFGGLT